MRTDTRLMLALALVLGLSGACGPVGHDDEASAGGLAPGVASCEAWADRELEQCPTEGANRLFNIERCEEDRVQREPIGCGEAFARWVLCASEATYDCAEGWPIGCEDEFDAMTLCPTLFARQTGCSRVPRDRECEGQPQPYSLACFGAGAPGCVPLPRTDAEQILDVGMLCCPSYAREAQSFFSDPVLGPDELPPDYSGIDFADHAACVGFSGEQGWGTCEESAGCACTHCAAEVATCASEYACLFTRRCALPEGCDPNSDPFFTGYGPGGQYSDDLDACMEAAGCTPACP